MRPPIMILLVLVFSLLALPIAVQAQIEPVVQEINDSLGPGQSDIFRLDGLKRGQVLYAFMENTSGNLDPILSIHAADENFSATMEEYKISVAELAATSDYPLLDLPALRDEYSLAWDDDGGPGYAAALQFQSARGWRLFPAGQQLAFRRRTADRRELPAAGWFERSRDSDGNSTANWCRSLQYLDQTALGILSRPGIFRHPEPEQTLPFQSG